MHRWVWKVNPDSELSNALQTALNLLLAEKASFESLMCSYGTKMLTLQASILTSVNRDVRICEMMSLNSHTWP